MFKFEDLAAESSLLNSPRYVYGDSPPQPPECFKLITTRSDTLNLKLSPINIQLRVFHSFEIKILKFTFVLNTDYRLRESITSENIPKSRFNRRFVV